MSENFERYCDCLVEFTRQYELDKLDDVLVTAVKQVTGAKEVFVLSRYDEEPAALKNCAVLTIKRGPDDSATLGILEYQQPPADSPESGRLRQVLEVYANQYHHLSRGNCDLLTGLMNRRVFDEQMTRVFSGHVDADDCNQPSGSGKKPHRRRNILKRALAILDVDHFKNVNDNYGHLYGDEVLILLAGMMRDSFRPDDWIFRYGGEEFIILLNNMDLDVAQCSLERFREKVARRLFPQVGRLTVSIGVTSVDYERGLMGMLSQADQALYYSKNNGRNRVSVYDQLVREGKLVEKPQFGGEFELL